MVPVLAPGEVYSEKEAWKSGSKLGVLLEFENGKSV